MLDDLAGAAGPMGMANKQQAAVYGRDKRKRKVSTGQAVLLWYLSMILIRDSMHTTAMDSLQ